MRGTPVSAAVAFAADYLRTSLIGSRTGRRYCVYAGNHPFTGTDCRHQRWNDRRAAHGGSLVSPWCSGLIDLLTVRTKREHSRREVLRTWGVGIRALQAEQKAVHA